jgi:hypothetical protein
MPILSKHRGNLCLLTVDISCILLGSAVRQCHTLNGVDGQRGRKKADKRRHTNGFIIVSRCITLPKNR